MKLKRVVFIQSVEAPGRSDRVAYLQSNEPERRDCYAPDLWLSTLGVQAGDDIYPIHLVRRMTVDSAAVLDASPQRERFVEAMNGEAAVPRRPRRHNSSAPSVSGMPAVKEYKGSTRDF